ncbi:unnamed protein product [Angiostrongylus costaricensis]|uniref:AlbA_2 domain-containing protein n=1 Tax=Angiostrongylus costaricensis TaxID=334426 RepID=A0A0R3PGV4_ANGCS|nr:unnamed protein product [Angiostrongylus costaricensis]
MTTRRIYAGESCVLSEDLNTKFTLHYKHCSFEIPSNSVDLAQGTVRPPQPLSRTIAAFLNTEGGNIYVGIDENAKIHGIRLSTSMKDHFLLSMNYCISLFKPPVPPELVKVHFVELVESLSESSAVCPASAATQFCVPPDDSYENVHRIDSISSDNYSLNHLIGEETCPCENTATAADSKLYLIVIEVSNTIIC